MVTKRKDGRRAERKRGKRGNKVYQGMVEAGVMLK